MVKVFPEPVWPYANIHTLKPSSTERISGWVSEKTSSAFPEQERKIKKIII